MVNSSEAFKEFANLDNFKLAFKRISSSTRLEIKDWLGLQVYGWSEHTEKHLQLLLRSLENYQPHPAHSVYFPKQDRSLRRYAFLSIDDRIVYQAIGNYIINNSYNTIKTLSDQKRVFGNIPTPPENRDMFVFLRTFSSFNHQKKLSTVGQYDLFKKEIIKGRRDALSSFSNPWLIKTDVFNYYSEIDHEILRKLLIERQWCAEDSVIDLMFKCLNSWKHSNYPKGIPIGYETSDYLSNLYLIPVDEALHEYTVKRYVDDIYIFVESYEAVKQVLYLLDNVLDQLELQRNASKTELLCLADISGEELGTKLGKSLSFLAKERRHIKSEGRRQKHLYKLFSKNYESQDDNLCNRRKILNIREIAFTLYRLKIQDHSIKDTAIYMLDHYPDYYVQALTYLESNYANDSGVIKRITAYLEKNYEPSAVQLHCFITLAKVKGFASIKDTLLQTLKDTKDWFLKYGLMRSVLEDNLLQLSAFEVNQLFEQEHNSITRAYGIWLAAHYYTDNHAKTRIVNIALDDDDIFIKKLGIYLWKRFGLKGIKLSLVPEYLRDQFLEQNEISEIETFHELFHQLFRIKLPADLPIERIFGSITKASRVLTAIAGSREQGMDIFVENIHMFACMFLNGVVRSKDPSHKSLKRLKLLREYHFDNTIYDAQLRSIESFWDDLKRNKRLKNGNQEAILGNFALVLHEYLPSLYRQYLGVSMRSDIFICYSHNDKEARERIKTHLKPLLANRSTKIWDDTEIKVGLEWDKQIKEAIQRAKVAILLVSADFLASEYIMKTEVSEILAAQREGLRIVWIAIKPAAWKKTFLDKLQCAHNPKTTLSEITNEGKREKVWADIANKIVEIFEE